MILIPATIQDHKFIHLARKAAMLRYTSDWYEDTMDDIHMISVDDKTVGFVQMELDDGVNVKLVVITPWHRNKGYCTELLTLLGTLYGKLKIAVHEDNPAIRLFLRLGFVQTEYVEKFGLWRMES